MKPLFNETYLFVLLMVFSFSAGAQVNDSIHEIHVRGPNSVYKDFVVLNSQVYALTVGDSLIVWNLRKPGFKVAGINIKAIAKTSSGRIAIGRADGSVGILGDKRKSRKIDFVTGKIYKIFVDKDDQVVTYTDEALWYRGQPYRPPTKSVMYRRVAYHSSKLQQADVTFLDSSQRIWFTFDNGEWGGNAAIFDLNSRKFENAESLYALYSEKYDNFDFKVADSVYYKEFPELIKYTQQDTLKKFPYGIIVNHVKGIAEDSRGNFLISESLMHFYLDGGFAKIEKSPDFANFYKITFLDDVLNFRLITGKVDNSQFSSKSIEEYLGPVSFNRFNNSMYYYSNEGFFKLIENGRSYKKEFLFRPWIIWNYGLAHSVGYQMNVVSFEFISEEEIIFISPNAGIGYFNGTSVTYYK